MGQIIYFANPNFDDRELLLKYLKKLYGWSFAIDLAALANRTAGFSYADICQFSQDAAYLAFSKELEHSKPYQLEVRFFTSLFCIQMTDFENLLQARIKK